MRKRTSGIYAIRNILNGQCYIGASKDIQERIWTHKGSLRNGTSHHTKLMIAWKLYGEACFEFIILKSCDRENLEREELLWHLLHPEYNIKLGKYLSQEAKDKLRLIALKTGYAPSEECRQKARETNIGRVHSEEEKSKMKGRKASDKERKRISEMNRNRVWSEESRRKASESTKRRYSP
jgi:group I intron endonuclease